MTEIATVALLKERIAELEGALEPFATYMANGGDRDNHGNPLPDDQWPGWVYLTMRDFRRARAALGKGVA